MQNTLTSTADDCRPAVRDEPPRLAVLIPCHNEALTIAKVVSDFRRELPTATVYVIDNCSQDATAQIARRHGAVILREPRKGKGFVVEGMFDRIDADFYIMVDGDDTYPAEYAQALLDPVLYDAADMVIGARPLSHDGTRFRRFHVFGNNLVRWLVNLVARSELTDIMSGYRAFNRRVVRSLPVTSAGFEVETDLTLQMLYYKLKIVEVPISYRPRPSGSQSKLRTVHDGAHVLWKIFTLFREFKPLTFFGGVAIVFFFFGLLAGSVPVRDYFTEPDHYVSHLPLAILATGLMILSAGSAFLGVLLHALNWRFRELHNVLTRESSMVRRARQSGNRISEECPVEHAN